MRDDGNTTTVPPAGLHEPEPNDPADDGEVTQEEPRNLLGRLRERRAELAEEQVSGARTLTLPIPGYAGDLYVEFTYAANAFDHLKKIGRKMEKSRHPRKELHGAMDTLAFACTNVFVSEDGGETLEPIDRSGEPVRFDDHLAELLGFNADNARQVIAEVFNNDMAVIAMSTRVSEWMQGEDEEVDEDFPRR